MEGRLRASRAVIERDLRSMPGRWEFSPATYAQYRTLTPLLKQYARGELIDLGCGDMPFKEFLAPQVTAYHSLDLFPRSPGVTFAGDVQDMSMVPSARYDTAICLETLEHVPDTKRALSEIHRILKPGGVLVLSVPHLSRLHDEPHDYYRFTVHGLRYLLTGAGFVIVEMRSKGAVFSFLGHQASSVLLSAAWPLPGVRRVAWFLNRWLLTRPCYMLDKLLYGSGVLALGYVAVAAKPAR